MAFFGGGGFPFGGMGDDDDEDHFRKLHSPQLINL